MPAFRDNDVRILLRGLDEKRMARPYYLKILLYHAVERPSPLVDIPKKPPDEPDVIRGIDIDLEIEELSDAQGICAEVLRSGPDLFRLNFIKKTEALRRSAYEWQFSQ